MDGFSVHFEVFVRRTPGAPWSLDRATENRTTAIEAAEELYGSGRVAAVKVTKETLDEDTREFQSVSILKLGAAEAPRKAQPQADLQPLCVTPQDLYTLHARERIGRLLEGWLERNNATPFELLHRPDLVEKLEASGTDLQHAIQKIAVPEAHARAMSVHELMRVFQALVERAVERLLKDQKKGALPNVDKEGFAAAAERVVREPDRTYLLGAGVAASIARATSWSDKVLRLLDLADAAPRNQAARTLAFATLEQPLAEIMESKPGLGDLLGKNLEPGDSLAALTRLIAHDAVEALIRAEPSVAKVMPELTPTAQRLARWLSAEDFADVRIALGKRILRELNGPRRLKPGDAEAEIDVLRALAMALTAASGKLLPLEDVTQAFSHRSRMLVTGDFVEAYLGQTRTAAQEAEALIWLTENVIGAANKRQAGRWLRAVVGSLRFEKEMLKAGEDTAAARLAQLANLQRAVGRCGLAAEDAEPVQTKLGDIGGLIEGEARMTSQLAKANASAAQRLMMLLKLASGETAPLGPAASRARVEALKLVRHDDTRAELAKTPEHMDAKRELVQQAGLAA